MIDSPKFAKELVSKFYIPQDLQSFEPFGNGHINDTYLATVLDNGKIKKYIFQRINSEVFKDVDALMNNIVAVTEFIRYKLRVQGKDPEKYSVTIVRAKDDKTYYKDENGNYYRCTIFLEGSEMLEQTAEPQQFYIAGKAFGQFQKLMSGFDASILAESIPNFHNTVDRLAKFKKAVEDDKVGRVKDCQTEIDFFLSRSHYASVVLDRIKKGTIPLRVTHNDTKLNNVLLDLVKNEPIAVLDLDTVMPGSILYDFGDSIRFGASTAAEDEPDLSKVNFSMDLFKAFAEGFVGEVKSRLTLREVKYMHFGAILMTYECGMRFLTDYLNGDTYFKTSRKNQNLDRARTHIKLVQEMEKVEKEMQKFIIGIVFELD